MKLKKILAQSLAVAMVLSSVPVANFTALAAEDPAAYASDDAGIVAATETDVLPAPYGYKNLQLTVGPDVKITTSANTEITESSGNVLAANGANNGASPLQFDNSGDKWINFHFEEAKKVSGLLYKNRYQTNGPVKIARVDVKKQGSNDYITVYQTETASAWTNPREGSVPVHEALFNTVSDVTDVKFYAVETHCSDEATSHTMKADAMRILTIEDGSAATATALTSGKNSGTATVSIPDSTVSGTTMSVSKGVTVKYQAKAAEGGRFLGWRNASGDVLSYDTTYTTTVSDDITLTAVFENYYEKIDQSVLKANAKDNSHAQGSRQADGTYNDGAAANAFDNNVNTLWHENYDNTGAGSQTKPSASNPIWIQTSFGTEENGNNKVKTVGCLTYRGRPDSYAGKVNTKGLWSTRISDYVILAANVEKGSPKAGDWAVVKAGTMPSDISVGNAVSELEFTPVNATHIRLVCLSTYENDNFVCAGEINLYKVKDTSAEVSELKDITIQGVENGSVTIVPSGYETTNDANETAASGESASIIGKEVSSGLYVKLIAVPKEGYQFAGWKNIEKDKIVSRESTYLIKDTEVTNYKPVFSESNYSEIKVLPDNWTDKQSNPSNIRANSQMLPPNNNGTGNDGPAWYAFDKNGDSPNTVTLWHGNYSGSYVASGDNMNIQGNPNGTEAKKLWVEVSFSNNEKIKRITVTPRRGNDGVTRPKDYEIWVANTDTTPSNENFNDFVKVASGTFGDNTDVKTIDLPVAVQPSHIRIVISSVHQHNNTYMAVANISLYENTADTSEGAKVVAIPVPEVNDNTMGTVSLSKDKYVKGLDTEVTLTARPNTGYHFVKWIVNDNSGNMVSELNNATETVTMNSMSGISYQALFAKDAEVNISLDQTYLTMYVDDTQKLEATVKNATDTSVVTWTTTDSDVATVDNGTVTAKKAGETTITATTSVGNDEKSATCTVVVNEKPSKAGLLTLLNEEASGKAEEKTQYSEESREALRKVCESVGDRLGTITTQKEIDQAEKEIRTAMSALVPIYKVSVPNDNKIELTSDKAENKGEDNDYKWIYTPLFAKVSLNVTGLDLNNEEFTGWIYNGKTVCTSTSYKFYVVGEMQLRYEMGTKVKEEVNLFCSSEYSTTLGKLSFIGKRAVPSRYKVVEHGIVITDAIGWEKYRSNQKAFVKGASRTKKSIASGKSNYGTFEAKLKCGRDEEWHGRYYVTYTDGTTTYTLYSDVENYPHDDFK